MTSAHSRDLRHRLHGGMVGAVRMWRHGVAGVVVTALVLMPGLATTCAAACLRQTPATAPSAAGSAEHAHHGSTAHAHHGSTAHAHHGSTAHAHHGSTPAQSEMRVRAQFGVAPVHNCRDHAGAVHWSGTVSRFAGADRQVVSASEPPRPCPLGVSVLIARHARSTHGPPGASGVVTPLVLRI